MRYGFGALFAVIKHVLEYEKILYLKISPCFVQNADRNV